MIVAPSANDAKPDTVAWLIAEAARVTPGALAILAPSRTPLAFGALMQQIGAVTHALAARGLGHGTRVGLALAYGPEAAVAVLAVTSCATCVPLNPDSDEATIRFLYRRLRVDAVIVAENGPAALCNVARELALPVVTLTFGAGDPAGVFALHGDAARRSVSAQAVGPDDLALVLHTSGTTGAAKAVPLTHRSQFEGTLRRMQQFRLTRLDRGLCVAPVFTATGIRRSLFPPLATGGSIVCAPRFDAERMLDWLSEFEPTFYAAGPAVHQALLEAIGRRGSSPRHSLRFVASGSTALSAELQAQFEETLGVPLAQSYAMTEAGVITQTPLPPGERRPGSTGVPPHGEVGIIGDDGSFLGPGEPGEIVVRGPEVFGGYEDDAEANRQAFIGDWFRTGDLGYRDADGYLYVTGRLKETINRGGFKVPPSEVDTVLMTHPAVADAAAFGIAHPTLGEDVMAVVVLHDTATVTTQQLRDFAFGRLADFKVPTRIVTVATIPRTALGKARRGELTAALGPAPRPAYEAPRDLYESAVVDWFAGILGAESVGIFDNFFALGGDSLRGAQVLARANARFGCRLAATSLFRRPTAAEFAVEIKDGVRTAGTLVPPSIVALPRTGSTKPDDASIEPRS